MKLLLILSLSTLLLLTQATVHQCMAKDRTEKCKKDKNAVVGFTGKGTFGKFDNMCKACENKEIKTTYTYKECPAKVKGKCGDIGVCGMTKGNVLKEFDNWCDACNAKSTIYINGKCPNVGKAKK